MWPLSEILTINVLSNLVGLFIDSDYRSDMLLEMNINILEKKVIAESFEFSPQAMEMTNAIAQNRFSEKFLFGVASSAYQIEGAYNSSGKGISVWDYWTHNDQNLVKDKSNGDIACDSYNKYEDDVQLVNSLGANTYRISLSWTRILPDGLSNNVNHEGIAYYNKLINTMILNGITPVVTLHHFDIPYKLQLMGGWTNPKMIEYFKNYAKIAFVYFGDRVKYWITINDPWELCNVQFGNSLKPVFNDSGTSNYLCGHHVILAHAAVYSLYHEEFAWLQKGKVGISLGMRWFEPEDSTSDEDIEAANLSFQFANYWFLNPLVGEEGDYPDIMRLEIDIKSALQRFKKSRLPTFDSGEIDFIKSSLDFLGINFFTTYSVRSLSANVESIRYCEDYANMKVSLKNDMSGIWLPYDDAYGSYEVKNTAENFGKLLQKVNSDYILPQIYITANGYDDFGEIYDINRAAYYYDHIKELFEAMKAGIDMRGYIAWSLLDSFEWKNGYTQHFGLCGVDFNDENRPRFMKLSTNVIQNIYESKTIPADLTIVEI